MEMPDNTRFASAPSLPHPVFHQRKSQTAKVIGLHFMPALATFHDGIVCSQFFFFSNVFKTRLKHGDMLLKGQ